MKFDAVIFDMDGTLIDSMQVWKKIDVDFLTKRALDVPSDYMDSISALSFRETALYTIDRFGLKETPDDLMREWNEMAAYEYGHNIGLKPYAREYLERLKAKNVKLAIATSSPDELCGPVLANNGIRGFFDAVCSVDEVTRGKEHPDIFIHTAEKLGANPEGCLVFEDILPAIKSAKSAGMSAFGIYDPSSMEHWGEIMRVADGFLYDFQNAPAPD